MFDNGSILPSITHKMSTYNIVTTCFPCPTATPKDQMIQHFESVDKILLLSFFRVPLLILCRHVGILEIRGKNFRLNKIPLQTVRPFYMQQIVLADADLDPTQEEQVQEFLQDKVCISHYIHSSTHPPIEYIQYICLFTYIHPPMHPSTCPSIHPPIYASIYLYHPSVHPPLMPLGGCLKCGLPRDCDNSDHAFLSENAALV